MMQKLQNSPHGRDLIVCDAVRRVSYVLRIWFYSAAILKWLAVVVLNPNDMLSGS